MFTVRSGLLVINKPAGLSSRDCVNHVQRVAGDRKLKLGHAGTLDPMATGVLLLVVGEATRLVEQLHELDKAYSAEFEFGKSSDTLDREGEVCVHNDVRPPSRETLEQACVQWTGHVLQRPPRYSAVKINGRRAYDMARSGAEFEPVARPVRIDSLTLTDFDYPNWSLDIRCGSGTYVRSIGRDVAAEVQSVAIMTALVRTAIGPFTLADSCRLDELRLPSDIESRLRSPLDGLPAWHRITIAAQQTLALRHGQRITLKAEQWPGHASKAMDCAAVDESGQLIALVEVSSTGQARPVRVFQTAMATTQPSSTSAKHNPES